MSTTQQTQQLLERQDKIRQLQELRGRPLLTYVTSTRTGADGLMATDAIPVIYQHLMEMDLSKDRAIDLLLHTNGGESVVPWRLMSLLREFADEVNVLVPHHAHSAGTLTALGADRVIMHPMGMLGPTDPTVITEFNPTGEGDGNEPLEIEVEDVGSYIRYVREIVGEEDADRAVHLAFEILSDRVHPLALGAIHRSTAQSRLMGKKLINSRADDAPALDEDVIDKLTSELFDHRHPISRREAKDQLGLTHVEDADPEIEQAMWDLYLSYAEVMQFDSDFDAGLEAVKANGGKLPDPPPYRDGEVDWTVAVFPVEVVAVLIESTGRSNRRQSNVEVSLARASNGDVDHYFTETANAWESERLGD